MNKLSIRQQITLCFFMMFIVLILLGNSNNIPDSYAERIFKPIILGTAMIHYSGIIMMVVIFMSLTHLNTIQESILIKTGLRRVIMVFVLIGVFSDVTNVGVQVYKGFFSNLNAIYLDRQTTSLQFNGDQDKMTLSGTLELKNCSPSTQTFQIKIKAPHLIKDLLAQEYVILEETWTLHPRESKTVHLNEDFDVFADYETSYSNFNVYEYMIYNQNDEAIFKGTLSDYQFDEWSTLY